MSDSLSHYFKSDDPNDPFAQISQPETQKIYSIIDSSNIQGSLQQVDYSQYVYDDFYQSYYHPFTDKYYTFNMETGQMVPVDPNQSNFDPANSYNEPANNSGVAHTFQNSANFDSTDNSYLTQSQTETAANNENRAAYQNPQAAWGIPDPFALDSEIDHTQKTSHKPLQTHTQAQLNVATIDVSQSTSPAAQPWDQEPTAIKVMEEVRDVGTQEVVDNIEDPSILEEVSMTSDNPRKVEEKGLLESSFIDPTINNLLSELDDLILNETPHVNKIETFAAENKTADDNSANKEIAVAPNFHELEDKGQLPAQPSSDFQYSNYTSTSNYENAQKVLNDTAHYGYDNNAASNYYSSNVNPTNYVNPKSYQPSYAYYQPPVHQQPASGPIQSSTHAFYESNVNPTAGHDNPIHYENHSVHGNVQHYNPESSLNGNADFDEHSNSDASAFSMISSAMMPTIGKLNDSKPEFTYPNVQNIKNKMYFGDTASEVSVSDRVSVSSSRMDVYNECIRCLKKNDVEANFCSKCGNPMTKPEIPSICSTPPSMVREASITPTPKNVFPSSNIVEHQPQKPKRIVYPVSCFGFGGKLVLIFPKTQQRFVNENGQSKTVNVYFPGVVNILKIKSMDNFRVRIEKPLNMKSLKRKDLIAKIEKYIEQIYQDEENGNEALLWKLMKYFVENDGVWSGTELSEKLRNLLSSDLSILGSDYHLQSYHMDFSKLKDIESHLLKGDRMQACYVAIEAKLWTHALLISSYIDKDTYYKVVNSFAIETLPKDSSLKFFCHSLTKKAAYKDSVGPEIATNWKNNLLIILANRSPQDRTGLTILARELKKLNMHYASHICNLFTGTFFEDNSSDFFLIGKPASGNIFDPVSVFRSEVYEYAIKSNPSNTLQLPKLQIMKLIYAYLLADYGYVEESISYCESIAANLKTMQQLSPMLDMPFYETLKELNERLNNIGISSKTFDSSSWISKMQNNLMNAFENTLIKVAGVEETVSSNADTKVKADIPTSMESTFPTNAKDPMPANYNQPYINTQPYQPYGYAPSAYEMNNSYQPYESYTGTTTTQMPTGGIAPSDSAYNSYTGYSSYGGYQPYVPTENNYSEPVVANTERRTNIEDDDLGLGNPKPIERKEVDSQNPGEVVAEKVENNEEKSDKTEKAKGHTGSKSSIFGWFNSLIPSSSASTAPKPVQVHLGEESQFYYDNETKRWVNKRADSSTSASNTPSVSNSALPTPGQTPQLVRHSNPPASLAGPPIPASTVADYRRNPSQKRGARSRYVDTLNPNASANNSNASLNSMIPKPNENKF